jgi:hypothetical protein
MEIAITQLAEAMKFLVNKDAVQPGLQAAKVKVPLPSRLSGDRDAVEVENWIADMDHYFKLTNLREEDQLEFAVTLFGPKAKTWWRRLQVDESSDVPLDWQELREAVRMTFVPAGSYKAARNRLASLRQTGPVAAYVEEFDELRMVIGNVTEPEALDKFVRGLKQEVQLHLATTDPSTVKEATRLALAFDEARSNHETRPRWTRRGGPTPMELDYAEASKKKWKQNKSKTYNKKKCYVCGSQAHFMRNCPVVEAAKESLKGQAQGQ